MTFLHTRKFRVQLLLEGKALKVEGDNCVDGIINIETTSADHALFIAGQHLAAIPIYQFPRRPVTFIVSEAT